MSNKKTGNKIAEPMIRFGGEWIPAHDLWDKMETANVVADAIERFNQDFPNLSSDGTREVVPLVRQRLKDIDLRMPGSDNRPDFGVIAHDLLETMTPENVVQMMAEKHDMQLDIAELIQLAGEQAYVSALAREASEFAVNLVSPEQTAELWNDTARPPPGGGLWTAHKVQNLLDQADQVPD